MSTPRRARLRAPILIGLTLLAGLAFLLATPTRPTPERTHQRPAGHVGPWFEVQVTKPSSSRPMGGLVPESLLGLDAGVFRIDTTSVDAEILHVSEKRLELRAAGWEFVLQSNGKGRVRAGTSLAFPFEVDGRERMLLCFAAHGSYEVLAHDRSSAHGDVLDGQFRFDLSVCEEAPSGKPHRWPMPLTVQGFFADVPRTPR